VQSFWSNRWKIMDTGGGFALAIDCYFGEMNRLARQFKVGASDYF